MIDHLTLYIRDYALSRSFFQAALGPLGYELLREYGGQVAGFGENGKPDFWITTSQDLKPTHIAFRARSRAIVDAFHRAAVAAGGKDNGAPGVRAQYHPNYYGAFVLDPDGNNIEAVCHDPG